MNKPFLLPLNLQFFADNPNPSDDNKPDTADSTSQPNNDGGEPEKRFTQADVDRIIKERLERERKKQEERLAKEREEVERKKLEEQQQFKELAEKYREELEVLKADALNAKKDALLAKAGYSDEQIGVLRKSITGETDEEISQSIEDLKAIIPPKPTYVDPSPMNGERDKPEPKDPGEVGLKAFERIKNKLF